MLKNPERRNLLMSGLMAGAVHLIVATAAICALAYGLDYASRVNHVYLVSGESSGDQPNLSVRSNSNLTSISATRQPVSRVLEKAEPSPVPAEAKKISVALQPAAKPVENRNAPHVLSVSQLERATIETVEFASPSGPDWKLKVQPVYPLIARRMNKEGKVLLKLTIDEKGKLLNADVVEAAGYGFTEAALDAVRKSTYRPRKKNGAYTASLALLPIRFRLTD